MRKVLSILLIMMLFMTLFSCGKKEVPKQEIDIYATTVEQTTATKEPQKSKIVVFVDNSLAEYMDTVKKNYESSYENTNIIYQFDTSESLKNQIVNMADCDVFISNNALYLDQIDINKTNDVNKEMLDFIVPNTRTIVFKGNEAVDAKEDYEACVIRLGSKKKKKKRFVEFLTK